MLKSDYVDKTGLINNTIGTKKKLTCISRPRRVGKSYAAQMLCAYYDKTCDSRELFSSYEIAGDPGFETHIMKYDVIYLDMTGIKPYTQMYASLVPFLIKALSDEIKSAYPDVTVRDDLSATLVDAVWKAGNKLI